MKFIFKVAFVIGLAVLFNACGSASKIDENLQNAMQEETQLVEEDPQEKLDRFIEERIDNSGVLVLSENDLDEELISRVLERQLKFMFIDLSNRDSVIEKLEAIFKSKKESYRIAKEDKKGLIDVAINTIDGAALGGVAGTAVPGVGNVVGAVAGGVGGFLYSLKDYAKELFAKKVDWLILKSADKSILKVDFVKDLQ